MISFVRGNVDYIGDGFVIIDCNGMGFNIGVTSTTLSKLKLNTEIKIFTYMSVKDDGISLFGFMSNEELNMFNNLIGVNGVGPKSALSLLDTMSPSNLALAIITEDIRAISGGQGIGKKTAQRIVLELKDKISNEEAIEDSSILSEVVNNTDSSAKNEAIEGLMVLGFNKNEAASAVNAVYIEGMSSSDIISKALRVLG